MHHQTCIKTHTHDICIMRHMHTHTCITHACTHTHTHIHHIHTCTYTHTSCMHTCTHTHASCTHIHTRMHTHVCMYVHTCIHALCNKRLSTNNNRQCVDKRLRMCNVCTSTRVEKRVYARVTNANDVVDTITHKRISNALHAKTKRFFNDSRVMRHAR